MKKEGYYGKWILRFGDLKPEEITRQYCNRYGIKKVLLETLASDGLLFDTMEEAMRMSRAFASLAKEYKKRHVAFEEDLIQWDELKTADVLYEEIKKKAIEDLQEGPLKTLEKIYEQERRYKKAFNKVLAEKGVVTGEDIQNELNNMKHIYISGAISGHNIEERKREFKIVQNMLEEKGWRVFNPFENGLPEDSPTSRHMRRDLSVLTNEEDPFSAIYMMKGWNHSAGCWDEFHDALAIGLEVIFEQVGFPVKFE